MVMHRLFARHKYRIIFRNKEIYSTNPDFLHTNCRVISFYAFPPELPNGTVLGWGFRLKLILFCST